MPFFAGGALFYGQAQAEAFSSALHSEKHFLTPHFEWDPGIRLFAGGDLPGNFGRLFLRLTRLHTKARASIEGDLTPLWTSALSTKTEKIDALDERWRLHLGLIDALLDREWSPDGKTALGLFLGARFAIIRQKYKIEYRGELRELLSAKNKFCGAGPLLGAKLGYSFTPWAALYGEGSFSLLSGHFYLHEEASKKTRPLNLHSVKGQVQPCFEAELGLRGRWKGMGWQAAYGWMLFLTESELLRAPARRPEGRDLLLSQGALSFQGILLGMSYLF